MCGIYCAIKSYPVVEEVVEGLKRLQYRGYDSYGYGNFSYTFHSNNKEIYLDSRAKQMLGQLHCCLGHTRWSTHGDSSIINAHPIISSNGEFLVVHNGIINNYENIKSFIGYVNYRTETDTEVIANLLEYHCGDQEKVFNELKGNFAVAYIERDVPNTISFMVRDMSLYITSDGDISSDINAFTEAQKMNCDIWQVGNGYGRVHLTRDKVQTHKIWSSGSLHLCDKPETKREENKYCQERDKHRMFFEIGEQPQLIRNFKINPYTDIGDPIVLVGCGSSYNACLFSKYSLPHLSIDVLYASEAIELINREGYGYVFLFTQSGETLDVLNVVRHLNRRCIIDKCAVTNNANSSIAQICAIEDLMLGPEIAVAATKSFTLQCLTGIKNLIDNEEQIDLEGLANNIQKVIDDKSILPQAKKLALYKHVLILGSGAYYPIAMEGALKIKEVACIHAEAMPAAEIKHGPIALIDKDTLSIFLLPTNEPRLSSILSNIHQVKSRHGAVLVVAPLKQKEIVEKLGVPYILYDGMTSNSIVDPLIANVVLQLLSYYAALEKGLDPDKPRALAKSVTV